MVRLALGLSLRNRQRQTQRAAPYDFNPGPSFRDSMDFCDAYADF